MILLDTHVAVWLTTRPELVGKRTMRIVRGALAQEQVTVSALSFWEIALLLAKRRLRTAQSAGELRREVLQVGVRELPMTGEIAILAADLQDLHSDPADRFIAATAIVHDAILVTSDERLLAWRGTLRRQNAEA